MFVLGAILLIGVAYRVYKGFIAPGTRFENFRKITCRGHIAA